MMIDYKIVDLDLPSGTLWADRNIGSIDKGSPGLYYRCGKKFGYSLFNKKFQFDPLEHSDGDAVSHVMGNCWTLPSQEQFEELFNLKRIWVNGPIDNGIRFYGNNGNTLFIPATGALMSYKNEPVELNTTLMLHILSERCIYSRDTFPITCKFESLKLYTNIVALNIRAVLKGD